MKWTKEILAGAVGGLAGALVMSIGMMIGKKIGIVETPLPLKIEREVEQRIGIAEKTSASQEKVLAQSLHLMIGMVFGAGLGLLRAALKLPPLPSGPLYGLGVYGLNLAGVGPLFDLTQGPWNERTEEVGRRMMMHLLFGTVAAIVGEQVRQRLAD